MDLSENFTLAELTKSETAMKNNFSEQYKPSQEVIDNLKLLAVNVMEKITTKFGSFSPTVAYRCKRVNDKVGGAKNSEHLYGQAFDETFDDSKEVFFWVIKNLKFSKMIWEFGDVNQPRWLHIGYDTKNLNNTVLVSSKNALGKTVYTNYFQSSFYKKHKELGLID